MLIYIWLIILTLALGYLYYAMKVILKAVGVLQQCKIKELNEKLDKKGKEK